jgi:hypothetical protein
MVFGNLTGHGTPQQRIPVTLEPSLPRDTGAALSASAGSLGPDQIDGGKRCGSGCEGVREISGSMRTDVRNHLGGFTQVVTG